MSSASPVRFVLGLALPALFLAVAGCTATWHGASPAVDHPPSGPSVSPAPEPWVRGDITLPERQIIQGYVAAHVVREQHPGRGRHPRELPRGLQKKLDRGGSLPPGWETKLRKGQILPPEVYRHCEPLPREIVAQLPPPPPGTILVAVSGKVVRLLQATREILDVFEVQY